MPKKPAPQIPGRTPTGGTAHLVTRNDVETFFAAAISPGGALVKLIDARISEFYLALLNSGQLNEPKEWKEETESLFQQELEKRAKAMVEELIDREHGITGRITPKETETAMAAWPKKDPEPGPDDPHPPIGDPPPSSVA